jgi:hypothetical protein
MLCRQPPNEHHLALGRANSRQVAERIRTVGGVAAAVQRISEPTAMPRPTNAKSPASGGAFQLPIRSAARTKFSGRKTSTRSQASRTYHGVDPGAGERPRTLLRDDQFPAAGIERGDRALDGDLHLTGCGRGGSGESSPGAIEGPNTTR